ITGKEPVLGPGGEGAAEDGRLLAKGANVKTNAALTLEEDESLVEQPRLHHSLINRDDLVGCKVRILARIEGTVLEHHLHAVIGIGIERMTSDPRRLVPLTLDRAVFGASGMGSNYGAHRAPAP